MNAKHFEQCLNSKKGILYGALILIKNVIVNAQVLKFEIRNFIWCTNSFSIIIKNVIVNMFTVRFKINIKNDFYM